MRPQEEADREEQCCASRRKWTGGCSAVPSEQRIWEKGTCATMMTGGEGQTAETGIRLTGNAGEIAGKQIRVSSCDTGTASFHNRTGTCG